MNATVVRRNEFEQESAADHLKMLQRRMDHLARRVANSARDLDWDRKEMAALKWAIDRLSA